MRLINVDELLKRLNQLYQEQGLTSECTGDDWIDGAGCLFEDIVEIINKQPTIEPVKRGKWLEAKCFDDGFWVCSNCKFHSQATIAYELYKYCPVCGVKMEG